MWKPRRAKMSSSVWPSLTIVSSSSRRRISDGWIGPLKVIVLFPDSMRTRSTDPWRRSDSSSLSSSASAWRRRQRSGVAPAAITAARAVSALSNRSLISRSSMAVMWPYLTRAMAKHQSNKGEHREALQRERRKAQIPGQRHLEDLDVLHDRHRVVPFCTRPVIPELPQHAAQQSAQQEVDRPVPVAGERRPAEARVDWIEQEDEAEPDGSRQIARRVGRHQKRDGEHRRAGHDRQRGERRPGRGGRPGDLRSAASTHDPDEIGAFEDRRPDGRERPRVADHTKRPVLRQPDVVPVAEHLVVALEDQPERNRQQREPGEFARRRPDPRTSARREHDGIGEQDEARPADRRVPRVERLDARERRRLRDDHDREADGDHVARTLNDVPINGGVPTPLPRISTFIVLPRPPGITRVLSAPAAGGGVSAGSSPSTKYVWSRKPIVCIPSSSAAARTLVQSTCAVMSCSPGSSSHDRPPPSRCPLNVVSVPAEWDAE